MSSNASKTQTIYTSSELGKRVAYHPHYDPTVLFPIPRKTKRIEIGVYDAIPFQGFDLWNHYEVSWLNSKGKPIVALATLEYPCESENIIESKSMKLYFNSLNNTMFQTVEDVQNTIIKDLSARVGTDVHVQLTPLHQAHDQQIYVAMDGLCLDELDVECSTYTVHADYLSCTTDRIEETLYSNLLKSNCLVTNQPDWATVQIYYQGRQIDHAGLLQYLVSFRNHNEFHEQCIERIFMDLMTHCAPEKLAVYGRYTRRGGLDINAYRATHNVMRAIKNQRLIRQ